MGRFPAHKLHKQQKHTERKSPATVKKSLASASRQSRLEPSKRLSGRSSRHVSEASRAVGPPLRSTLVADRADLVILFFVPVGIRPILSRTGQRVVVDCGRRTTMQVRWEWLKSHWLLRDG